MDLSDKEKENLNRVLQRLGFKTYLDFLFSDIWIDKAKAVLDAKGRECEKCHQTKCLQVHHKTYEHLGSEPLRDFSVLCRKCHKELHNIL